MYVVSGGTVNIVYTAMLLCMLLYYRNEQLLAVKFLLFTCTVCEIS